MAERRSGRWRTGPRMRPGWCNVRAVAEREATFAVDRIQEYVEMEFTTKKA